MAPSENHVPDGIIRITPFTSRRPTFTTKKTEERIRREQEDRQAKLENRALRRAEMESGLQEDLEKSESAATLGDLVLRKLAAKENTLKGLSRDATNCRERVDHGEGQERLEKMKRETVEALKLISHTKSCVLERPARSI